MRTPSSKSPREANQRPRVNQTALILYFIGSKIQFAFGCSHTLSCGFTAVHTLDFRPPLVNPGIKLEILTFLEASLISCIEWEAHGSHQSSWHYIVTEPSKFLRRETKNCWKNSKDKIFPDSTRQKNIASPNSREARVDRNFDSLDKIFSQSRSSIWQK